MIKFMRNTDISSISYTTKNTEMRKKKVVLGGEVQNKKNIKV